MILSIVRLSRCALILLALAAFIGLSGSASAQTTTYVWNGGTDASWSTATNWNNSIAPSGTNITDVVQFDMNSTGFLSTNTVGTTNYSIGQIVIGTGTTGSPPSAVTIGGTGGITLNSSTGIDMSNSTVSLTINTPLTIAYAGVQAWNVNTGTLLTIGNTVTLGSSSTGLQFLGAGNTSTGAITLATASSLTNSGTGNVTIASISGTATNLTFDGSGAVTVSGTIATTTGSLTKTNAGTLTLSGSNTFAGGVNISGGVLIANSTNALNTSGTISFGGGTLRYGTGITTDYSTRLGTTSQAYSIDTNGNSVTFATAFGGTAGNGNTLTKLGLGTLTLGATNTYTGGTTISAGTLAITTVGNLGTGPITLNGGTLQTSETTQLTLAAGNQITVGASGGTINNTVLVKLLMPGGGLTGSGTLTRNASANNALIGTNNDFQITGPNPGFTGNVILNGGQNEISAGGFGNVVGSVGSITINSGAELTAGNATLINPLIINAGGNIGGDNGNNGNFSGAITVNGAFNVRLGDFFQTTNRSLTISGNITGTGTISFLNANTNTAGNGAGQTLTLSGSNGGYNSAVTASPGYNVAIGSSSSVPGGGLKVNSTSTALGGVGVTYDFGATLLSFTNTLTGTGVTTGGVFLINTMLGTGTSINLQTLGTAGGGVSGMFLGSSTTGTYSYPGTLTPDTTNNVYRLGGGGGTLTLAAGVVLADDGSPTSLIIGDARTNGGGTVVLSNANTFTGSVNVNGGTVSVASLSSLGTATTIHLGNTTSTGGLQYTGDSALTTSYAIDLAGATGGGVLDQSGTGLLKFTSNLTTSVAGAKTLTLQGTSTGEFAGIIADSGTGTNKTSVTKTGTGVWTISGANSYTGLTTLTGGTLIIPSAASNTTSGFTISGGTNTTLLVNTTSIGSGNIAFNTGATTPYLDVHINGGGTITLANPLSGNSSIIDTIDVNNNGTGTGGIVNFSSSTSTLGAATLNVTGGNSYSLTINHIGNNGGSGGTIVFNPTSAFLSLGTLTGTVTATTDTWDLDGTAQGNSVTGIISNGTGTAVGAVLKTNLSSWTLAAANSYTGSTTIGGGNLILDFSASTSPGAGTANGTNVIAATSALAFSGGTLTVKGASAAVADSQTFASTALNAGGGAIVVNANGTTGTVVNLGAITRVIGGSLDITQPSGTISTSNGVTTTTLNNAAGILGGYVTVGGTDWAVSGASGTNAITAYTGYTTLTTAGAGSATSTNFLLSTAANTTTTLIATTGAITANSLKLTDSTATASASTLANNGNAITLNGSAGGLLYVPGTSGNTYTISGAGIVGAGANEFIVNVGAGGTLVLSAPIIGGVAGSLTKTGAGILSVTNTANAFTGNIYVNGGVLTFPGSNGATGDPLALGPATAAPKTIFVNNNAIIRPTSTMNTTVTGGVGTKIFSVGSGGATFDPLSGAVFQMDDATEFNGTGTLTVTTSSGAASTGYVYLGAQAYTFTGNVIIATAAVPYGALRLAGASSELGTSTGRSITVNSGGVLDIDNGGLTLPLSIVLNGTGSTGYATDGYTANGGALFASAAFTLTTPVTLASNSSIGGTAVLTISSNVSGPFALTKAGAGTVFLSGYNTYTGGSTISAGILGFNSPFSVPTTGTITIASTGALEVNNFTTADIANLLTTYIPPASALGALALTSASASDNVDFTNYPSLSLGAVGAVSYTGTYTIPASGIVRLGGGGGTLTYNQNLLASSVTSVVIGGGAGGTTILTGTNTYTGGTTISNGNTLSISSDSNIGGPTTAITFGSGGAGLQITGTAITSITTHPTTFTSGSNVTFDINNALNTFTLDKNVQIGTASFTKAGAGTLILTGTNSWTTGTIISGGILQPTNSASLPSGIPMTLSGTGTLDLNGVSLSVTTLTDVAATSIIDSNTTAGTGTDFFTVSAQATSVNSKILNGTTRNVAVQLSNANTAFWITNNSNTFAGGLFLLTNATTGTRIDILTAPTTTLSGSTIVSSPFGTGAITIGQSNSDKAGIYIPTTAANSSIYNPIVFNTALGNDHVGIRIDSTVNSFAGTITANYANATFSTGGTGVATINGQITGNLGLTLDGAGGTSLTIILNNLTGSANNYAGDTTIGANMPAAVRPITLTLGAANQIPTGAGAGNLILTATALGVPTFNMAGFSQQINGLFATATAGAGIAIVDGGAAGTSGNPSPILTLGDNNATASFNGVIKNTVGTLSLTKIGTGTQTLSGANTYGGTTTISAGQLAVTGAGSLASTSTLNLSPTSGSAAFAFLPTTPSTQTFNTITLTPGTSIPTTINLNYSGASVSQIVSSNAATTSGTINIGLSGTSITGTGTQTYTLLSSTNGGLSGATYNIYNPTNFTFTKVVSDTAVQITSVTSVLALGTAFWLGGYGGNVWAASDGATTSNWTVTQTGSVQSLVPGSGAAVTFSANGALAANQLGMTLGANMAVAGLTFNSSATVNNDANVLTIGASGITVSTSSTTAVILNNNIALSSAQTWTNSSTATNALTVGGNVNTAGFILTVTGPTGTSTKFVGNITGSGGITKSGAGTATLSAINNYTGATTIAQGTLAYAADQLQLSNSALTIGTTAVLNTVSPYYTAVTNTGALDLSTAPASAIFASLTVATNNTTANTIAIGSGKTLTVLGNFVLGLNLGTIANTGANQAPAGTYPNVTSVTSNLTVTGAGNLVIAGGTTNIGVAQTTQLNTPSASTLDLTGLSGSFTANVPTFDVAFGQSAGGTVKLTNTSNTIVAGTLSISDTNGANGGTGVVTLGTGTNVIQADILNVGASKGTATLAFASQTAGSPGTVVITNRAGSGPSAITIGNVNTTQTAGGATGTLNLLGHFSTVTAGVVSIGIANSVGSTSFGTGTLSFDTGTFNATSLNMAAKSGTGTTATSIGNATGTLNIGGGTFTVSGAASLGSNSSIVTTAAAGGIGAATINVTAGTLTIGGTTTLSNNTASLINGTASGSSGTLNISGTGSVILASVNAAIKSGTATGTTSATTASSNATISVSGGSLKVTGSSFILASQSTAGSANGTLSITASGQVTTNSDITDGGGSATTTITLNGATALLDLTGHNIGNATNPIDNLNFQAGTLQNVAEINGGANLIKTTVGTLNLAGSNSYTGRTLVNAGILTFTSIGTVGSGPSALGNPALANATIAIGASGSSTAAALEYVGTATATTDRVIDLPGTTGSYTLANFGSTGTLGTSTGAITFTNTSGFTVSGAGAKTLILDGTNQSDNTIMGGIPNSSSGNTSILKQGSGTWVLSGTNTYSGTTTITGGILRINGDNSGATGAINLTGTLGGTLHGSGILGGLVTVSHAGRIQAGNSATTLQLNGGLTIGSGSSGGTLGLQIVNVNGSTTPISGMTLGSSTVGTIPTPTVTGSVTSNDFYYFNGTGAVSLDPSITVAVDGTNATFANSTTYSYQIASGATNDTTAMCAAIPSSNIIFTGVNVSSASLIGDTQGDIFLNFTTAVPEPTALLGLAALGLGIASRRRRVR